MTIVVFFHGSGYKTFKEFYLNEVLKHGKRDFPKLVSYNRFVELIPWSLILLSCVLVGVRRRRVTDCAGSHRFLHTRRGKMTLY